MDYKYKLRLTEEYDAPFVWYKDEGGRDKCIEIKVFLEDMDGKLVTNTKLTLDTTLYYANGKDTFRYLLTLLPESKLEIDYERPAIIRFRINEVSTRHQGNSFKLLITPVLGPYAAVVKPTFSLPVEVKSKLPRKSAAPTTEEKYKKLKTTSFPHGVQETSPRHGLNMSASHQLPDVAYSHSPSLSSSSQHSLMHSNSPTFNPYRDPRMFQMPPQQHIQPFNPFYGPPQTSSSQEVYYSTFGSVSPHHTVDAYNQHNPFLSRPTFSHAFSINSYPQSVSAPSASSVSSTTAPAGASALPSESTLRGTVIASPDVISAQVSECQQLPLTSGRVQTVIAPQASKIEIDTELNRTISTVTACRTTDDTKSDDTVAKLSSNIENGADTFPTIIPLLRNAEVGVIDNVTDDVSEATSKLSGKFDSIHNSMNPTSNNSSIFETQIENSAAQPSSLLRNDAPYELTIDANEQQLSLTSHSGMSALESLLPFERRKDCSVLEEAVTETISQTQKINAILSDIERTYPTGGGKLYPSSTTQLVEAVSRINHQCAVYHHHLKMLSMMLSKPYKPPKLVSPKQASYSYTSAPQLQTPHTNEESFHAVRSVTADVCVHQNYPEPSSLSLTEPSIFRTGNTGGTGNWMCNSADADLGSVNESTSQARVSMADLFNTSADYDFHRKRKKINL